MSPNLRETQPSGGSPGKTQKTNPSKQEVKEAAEKATRSHTSISLSRDLGTVAQNDYEEYININVLSSNRAILLSGDYFSAVVETLSGSIFSILYPKTIMSLKVLALSTEAIPCQAGDIEISKTIISKSGTVISVSKYYRNGELIYTKEWMCDIPAGSLYRGKN